MIHKTILSAAIILALAASFCRAETYVPDPSIRLKINLGATPWKFTKGDPISAQTVAYSDAAWRTVGIPYTWDDSCSFLNMDAGGPDANLSTVAWYRKHFTLDNSYSSHKIFVEFEGAHQAAAVYINGTFIKNNDTLNPNATHVVGFIPFIVDLTPYVQFGGPDNVLAVKVSNAGGGFYQDPGFAEAYKYGMGDGGLFRPVWMHVTNKVYVPVNVYSVVNNWGTYVGIVSATDASATLRILTHVQNESGAAQTVTLTTKVVDSANVVVLSMDATQAIPADSSFVFDQTGDVPARTCGIRPTAPGASRTCTRYTILSSSAARPSTFSGVRWAFASSPGTATSRLSTGIRITCGAARRGTIIPHWAPPFPKKCNGATPSSWPTAAATCGGPDMPAASPEFTAACDAYGVMIVQPSGDIEGNFQTVYIASPTTKVPLKKELHRDMIIRDRNNPSILAWEVSNGPIDFDLEKYIRINIDSVWDPVHTRAMSDRGYWPDIPAFTAGIASTISCSATGCEIPFHQQYPAIPSWGAESWSGNNKGFRFDYDNELHHRESLYPELEAQQECKVLRPCPMVYGRNARRKRHRQIVRDRDDGLEPHSQNDVQDLSGMLDLLRGETGCKPRLPLESRRGRDGERVFQLSERAAQDKRRGPGHKGSLPGHGHRHRAHAHPMPVERYLRGRSAPGGRT